MDASLNLRQLVDDFFLFIQSKSIEIYNEFSLQHELGIFLREKLPDYRIQFERNVSYFTPDNKTIKKEIDIIIFNEDKSEKYAIELKCPLNGQYPEQMYSFVKDIKFMEELKNRLVGRGTETLDVINGRLRRAVEESRGMDKYDYLLINDDLEECVDTLHETIRCERMRTSRNHDFVSRIQKEAEAFL